MSHHTIIYGRISGATWQPKDYYRLHRLNSEIIEALPENDLTFPPINRSMFSIPNAQGIFRDQVITFGASYKTLEYEWHEWIVKFENILRQLYWYDVELHAEFEVMGDFKYIWLIEAKSMAKFWAGEIPLPTTEWTFEGNGPRTFLNNL